MAKTIPTTTVGTMQRDGVRGLFGERGGGSLPIQPHGGLTKDESLLWSKPPTAADLMIGSGDRGPDHVLGSSAIPPSLPAVRIDVEAYWDGGIYSNTPVEVVFDDNPRRNSIVFAVQT